MSFFVSESLKGRVTEENLLDTKQGDEKLEREAVYVRVSFEKFSHEFKFISLKKEKLLKTLIIEIPQSYKFLSALLTPNSKFEVIMLTARGAIYKKVKKLTEAIKNKHDVDLLPCPDIRPYYATYSKYPVHIGDRWKDKYDFSTFIGGILSLTPKLAKETNGYPNNFWGWGGEDDALYNRLSKCVNQICCPIEGDIKGIYHFNTQEKKKLIN